jgi:predicted RNA-binding Zn ribbon-like protein
VPRPYVTVEGVHLPTPLAGHPALEFCNTMAGWDGDDAKDYLRSYEHLITWARFSGALSADWVAELRRQSRSRADEGESVLGHARELRALLYDVLSHPADARALKRATAEIQTAAARVVLRSDDHTIRWEVDPAAELSAPVVAVAWSAGQFLTSPDLAAVRACPGLGCGWLFLDHRGRRRWCTMAVCGNRAKARRHEARVRRDQAVEDRTGSG